MYLGRCATRVSSIGVHYGLCRRFWQAARERLAAIPGSGQKTLAAQDPSGLRRHRPDSREGEREKVFSGIPSP